MRAAPAAGAGGGEFAAVVRRYFELVEIINETPHETDEELDADVDRTRPLLDAIQDVPIETAGDALAAMDFLIRENCIEDGWGPVEAIVQGLRGYLAGRVALT